MTQFSRLLALAVLVPLTAVACDKDEGPENHADDVASVRITAGTQAVTINSAGTATGGPITLALNTNTPVTATFLAANGSTITLSDAFRIDLVPATGVTFTSTDNFAGTLRGTTAGSFAVRVCVLHIAENHCDWGNREAATHTFPVTVQ